MNFRYFVVLGIILFAAILYTTGVENILSVFTSLNWYYFVIAIIVMCISISLKGYKWKVLSGVFGKFSTLKAIEGWVLGFALGIITPGRVGDFLRSLQLRNETNMKLGFAIASTILDRILDLIFLFVIGLAGLLVIMYFFILDIKLITAVVIVFILFVTGLFVFLRKNIIRKLLRPLFSRFVPEKHKDKLRPSFDDFYLGIDTYRKNKVTLLYVVFLTLLSWLAMIVQSFFLALAIGINVNFVFFLFIIPVIGIVELIPVSVFGLGTRDAVSILLFSYLSVTSAMAVSFAIGTFILQLLTAVVGLVIWMKSPIKI